MNVAIKKNFNKENCLELYYMVEDLNKLFGFLEETNIPTRTVKELKDG